MRRPTATIVLLLALSVIPATGWTQTADDLFNGQVLQRVDLRLHSADWEKLKADFLENTYYPADLTWNGVTVRNVGIRSRGHGSRSGSKPGLRVDFDHYSTDQQFLGLKSLVLDNLTQDSSGIHETVTMQLFARLGIPAPREAHARLYVDNKYAGLYVIVESVDKGLLARVFGSHRRGHPERRLPVRVQLGERVAPGTPRRGASAPTRTASTPRPRSRRATKRSTARSRSWSGW